MTEAVCANIELRGATEAQRKELTWVIRAEHLPGEECWRKLFWANGLASPRQVGKCSPWKQEVTLPCRDVMASYLKVEAAHWLGRPMRGPGLASKGQL